ncbi:MAG TPA: LuxR C-terminal-related transcriptional regulator [Candidatus Angelobacter sp.]|nr:LuxR C-terminal-related transcriptional regulator [Candidatus Angelobacter sp.]
MGRVSGADLQAIFGFLGSARLGAPHEPIPRETLARLRDLVHADQAEYFELRRADRAVLGFSESDQLEDAPGSEEAMHQFGHENPLNWRRWGPAHGAMRLSERVRRREFERTGFFDGFMRPNGLTDVLKVWLSSSAESAACVQLWRMGGGFSRRDQDVLGVLHQHLVAMRLRALTGGPSRPPVVGLTVREAEILTWAARGATDGEIAHRLGIATATVSKHLEHAYAALGVHSRAEAIGRILVPEPTIDETLGTAPPG